jgi:uncharacterized membrane protein
VLRTKKLIIVGFSDRDRALEVLPQLKRLHFSWSAGLKEAVAVEVESDGRLKLFQGIVLDAAPGKEAFAEWESLLGVLRPVSHRALAGSPAKVNERYAQAVHWFDHFSLNQEFVRNAAALLSPDSSAVMAIIDGGEDALGILGGYSRFVLHTQIGG